LYIQSAIDTLSRFETFAKTFKTWRIYMRTSGRPSKVNLPTFEQKFQDKYWIGRGKQYRGKFSPKNLFLTLVQLVGSTNWDGYLNALLETFGSTSKMPSKGTLSKVRAKVSFNFFATEFYNLIEKFDSKRWTFKGMRVYGIDGCQWNLPRTNDIIKNLYTGKAIGKYRSGYCPKMYVTHAWDVLTGVTKDVRYAPYLDEPFDARSMIKSFEKNSITLYDRLYISTAMIEAHKEAGNYFVMRARTNFKAVQRFLVEPSAIARKRIGDRMMTLLKVTNPKTNEIIVFVTNLRQDWVTAEMISELYLKRWESEISFKELSETLKIEQWHSKSLNGILQEFYVGFWLINYSRIQIALSSKPPENHLAREYEKPNYKLILHQFVKQMKNIFQGKRKLLKELKKLIKKSTDRRTHLSREYPRIVKYPRSHYPYYGWIWEFY
jgi:IS4 transposase